MVPRRGARRIFDLAAVADMTKQAMGEFVADLVSGGYLEIASDPADRRVRLVSLTPRGRDAADEAARALDRVESHWARALGREEVAELKRQLARIAGVG